jgi:hypothetical protein
MEEDVLALQFAANAPDEVADLPVAFQNPYLQVGEKETAIAQHSATPASAGFRGLGFRVLRRPCGLALHGLLSTSALRCKRNV